MKHFMHPRNTILRETLDPPLSSSPNPKSKSLRKQKCSKENAPPPDLNSQPSPAIKMKSPLPPRPPSSNPLKRKLNLETLAEKALAENVAPGVSDSGVKVIVRVRPLNKEEEDGEIIVQKLSNDAVTINGQNFMFDAVADTDATQLDIFQLVGAPLVENCLAGFNSSVFAYGQTGSGKTYTMWGPANALLEENLSSDQQGLTPRVFEQLFARINEEQVKHAGKQLKYQCRCSFLEIYNEQITDLLDPNQKNLQIREDVRSGVYVENLTEEYVSTMKDVTRLLTKGLSNRRTGSTTINAESSRSHCVFTCIVESRCKSMADGFSSFKTSRINLVDLAGSERQKLTGAAGERLKEAGNINRSLSQLGNLINILAEVSQTGKQRHIPYRDSRLTFLLQESLGGNAKLAMVCAISPAERCKSETFSTLRFAQRAKAIKNKAIVNEVMQDDVNFLREVIRQLRDELYRMKANNNALANPDGGYSTGWNARRSLSLLKLSLNHPSTLSHLDEDGDEEMEIDEDAVEKLCVQVGLQSAGIDQNTNDMCKVETTESDTDVNMEEETSEQPKNSELMIIDHAEHEIENPNVVANNPKPENVNENPVCQIVENFDGVSSGQPSEEKETFTSAVSELVMEESPCEKIGNGSPHPLLDPLCEVSEHNSTANACNNSENTSDVSPILKSPTPSISPRVNQSRKSLRTSSMLTASQKDLKEEKLCPENMFNSLVNSKKCISSNTFSTRKCTSFVAPTEDLAASLHRGLEIIDSHRQSSALRRSLFRFSLKPADSKPSFAVCKVDAGVQTFPQDHEVLEAEPVIFLCKNCKKRTLEGEEDDSSPNMQMAPVDGSESTEKSKKQVPKAVEKVLAGSIRREMALEEFCAKQASEITQLNRLVQQYKHERDCNAIIAQTREDKILRLESLMDGVLPTEEFMEEELSSLTHEHKLLKEKYENHPEILRTKIELKRVQDELEHLRNFYKLGEREVLLEEIQDLRSQLQYYVDSSSTSTRRRNPLLQLTYSCEPNLAPPLTVIPETTKGNAEQKLELERSRWTEAEGKWISLAEELRAELEASRSLAEKMKHELDTEKKCAEELKEAMQMAMEGNARMLEQYADLQEKHIELLARHRKIQEGIDDVKRAAARAGVRGAESRFINALAAEISALKVEREKERRYLRDENKGLQAQLRDTAEAVQAAGELLVRLKEAEEAVQAAEKRASKAEKETEKAYKQIDKLKKKHQSEINTLNELLAESQLPKEAIQPALNDFDMAKYDVDEPLNSNDQQWKKEFEPFYNGDDGELSKLAEPSSWFSGYDRCNV
ncbi:hypothetical protein SLA2020_230790 [Shorea laevis]